MKYFEYNVSELKVIGWIIVFIVIVKVKQKPTLVLLMYQSALNDISIKNLLKEITTRLPQRDPRYLIKVPYR